MKKNTYFLTGTGTNVGKTYISGLICKKYNFSYYKPIQTGSIFETDENYIKSLGIKTFPSVYSFYAQKSPHICSKSENIEIDIEKIKLPQEENLIVEGAGGVFVPINEKYLMIDLIKNLNLPVILVSESKLGTINHTLLTIEAIRNRKIEIFCVILNGKENVENLESIKKYGNISAYSNINEINFNS